MRAMNILDKYLGENAVGRPLYIDNNNNI